MTFVHNRDYNLEVLRGNISGHAMVRISGHDTTVPNGGPFGLSPGFGGGSYQFDQSAIAATPAAVIVSSTSAADNGSTATGMLTATVIGLNSSGVAATENVTLDGQTGVTTSATWSAVHAVRGLTWGSGKVNAGVLYVGTGALSGGIPAVRMLSGQIGHNRTQSGYYVVPAGKTLYLRQLTLTAATSNKDIEIEVAVSTNAGVNFIIEAEFGLEAGDFGGPIVAVAALTAGHHIKLDVAGGATSTVTAILGCELIDN